MPMSERHMGTQFRAECSYCTRSQAVAADMTTMVLHGYQRPGGGYTLGQCKGAHHFHFGTPEGRELARSWAKAAEVEAAHLKSIKPAADRAAAPWEARHQDYYLRHDHDAHVREAIRANTALSRSLPGDIRFYESYATDMNRRVADWTPQVPVEVKVVKGKLVHWRRGTASGARPFRSAYSPACVRSLYRMNRHYDCASDTAKVNCPKCIKIIAQVAQTLKDHTEGAHAPHRASWCMNCMEERHV